MAGMCAGQTDAIEWSKSIRMGGQASAITQPTNTTPLQPTELSVGWYHHSTWKIPVLEITSRTDDVFIQNIILNRGNCRIAAPGEKPNNPRLPARLKFGTKISFYTTMCQILEADIVTNRGTITYTFQ